MSNLIFDKAKAERAIRIIECLKLTGDFHGQPFVFEEWNKKIVSDIFGTMNKRGLRLYRDVYVEVPKKNVKSFLGCTICTKQLFDKQEPNGLIYFAGVDKESARSTLYEPLVEIITQDPALEKRVKITDSIKEIKNKQTGTILKVLSSDVANKHGPNPSLTVMDEIHAWHGRALYDVLTYGSSLARREPLRIVLTTAGDDPDRVTIGWELHEKAKTVIEARKPNGDKSKDIPTLYPVIFAYEGDDIWNEENWYKANPMLDIVFPIEALRELATEAKLSPANERLFRWLNLNQWTTTKLTSWLPLDLFDETNAKEWSRKDLLGKDCYIGGDFSTTTDLSAVCLIFPPQSGFDDWRVIWDCWIPEDNMRERVKQDKVPYDKWAADGWIYPTPGKVIDYTMIEKRFVDYKNMYNIINLPFDLSFATMLVQRLQEEHGLTVIDVPQQYATLTDPMNQIEVLLRRKQLSHEAHPVARWAFGNSSISKNGNAQIKLVKERKGKGVDKTKRIDLMTAMVNAMSQARFYGKGVVDLTRILDKDWGM